uniref:Desaturase n=1 Tax=Agrotis segetum TaxID=47767 RepID=A0A068FKB0_AGRSE|nr:desaturase [Agrotis segetum]
MEEENQYDKEDQPTIAVPFKKVYLWPNILFLIYAHIAGVYGLYLLFTSAKWTTIVFFMISFIINTIGITAGAHRLYSHKSYKAKKPLQVFLMLCHCHAYQRTLATWIRDHRLHHKYSDTDADPHNINRGFFFAHYGWLLVKSHPEVEKRRATVDMRDVYSNEVVMFQKRHKEWMLPLFAFIIPTVIPWLLGDTFSNSWHLNIFRFILTSNLTFLTNSLAHSWGYKPYDKTMRASQNLAVVAFNFGEGYHNFHHAFPWDYRSAELGNNKWNLVAKVIDFFEMLGLAYDLKMASPGMIQTRRKRTGDGTDLWGREIKEEY